MAVEIVVVALAILAVVMVVALIIRTVVAVGRGAFQADLRHRRAHYVHMGSAGGSGIANCPQMTHQDGISCGLTLLRSDLCGTGGRGKNALEKR